MAGGMVPIDKILNANPTYFRHDVGHLLPLMTDIRKHGQHAPVLLLGDYLVIDGARRIEALRALNRNEVWAISTNQWAMIRSELIAAGERERNAVDDPAFLSRSVHDLANFLPWLVTFVRSSMPQYRNDKGQGQRPKAESRVLGAVGTAVTAFGRSESNVKRISIIGRQLLRFRLDGDFERADQLAEWLDMIDRGELTVGGVHSLMPQLVQGHEFVQQRLEQMAQGLPVPATNVFRPAAPISAKKQSEMLNNMLSLLEGSLIAMGDPLEFSTEHSPEDIEKWTKRLRGITTFATRLNKRFRYITQEKANNEQL